MVDFENKKVNTKTLPEYLQAARASFSYDLRTVAHLTGISEKFIADLEGGYYHRLPSDVYVVGFLKKLSEIYKCDSSQLIIAYKKEKEIHQNINRYVVDQKGFGRKWKSFAITPKTIIVVVSGLLILSILGYLIYQVHAANTPPSISISTPTDGQTVESSSILLSGRVDTGAKLDVNGQSIYVDDNGNFKQMISVSPGQKVLTFQAQNNFGKSSEKEITIIADYKTEDTQPVTSVVSLTVTVGPNSTWISVQADNGQPDQETFLAGSSKTFAAQDRILLSTGDAGSTSISLNGKVLGKLGKDGETLRDIPFTADNVLTGNSTSSSTPSPTSASPTQPETSTVPNTGIHKK
jgi:cytoskeletal protein RodZ